MEKERRLSPIFCVTVLYCSLNLKDIDIIFTIRNYILRVNINGLRWSALPPREHHLRYHLKVEMGIGDV